MVEHPLGRGASGEVWRAREASSGRPVAIKLLRGEAHGVTRELQRAASLDHRSIVGVLDHGRLPGSTAGPGLPWIAFELVSGGSVADALVQGRIRGWSDVRSTLLALLAALGHAHARGVVHLDLKPGNVMLAGGRFDQARLTDFGVALAFDGSGEARILGTPSYMAPEQFQGRRAALGPWTDLYALACLAYAMCTGSPPVQGTTAACARAHLSGDIEPLRPTFDIPRGLEPWLMRLMSPAGVRPTSAARAAAALRGLGPTVRAARSTTSSAHDLDLETATCTLIEAGGVEAPSPQSMPRVVPFPTPDLPDRWPRARRLAPRHAHDRSSPSVAGVRAVPLIGREVPQTILWSALRTLLAGRSSCVWVRGPLGVGRTALIRRFGEAAAEVGACPVFELDPGRSDALPRAVCSRLRLADLSGLRSRAAALGLGPAWIDATEQALAHDDLASWLALTLADDPHIVLLLDGDAEDVMRDLATPTLWVVRSTQPPPQGVVDCPVAPLDPLRVQVLLRHVLPLDPVATEAWIEATGGRPGPLVRGVTQGVQSGAFTWTERGFSAQPPGVGSGVEDPVTRAAPLSVFRVPVPRSVAEALLGEELRELLEEGVLWCIHDQVGFVDLDVATATLRAAMEPRSLHRDAALACLDGWRTGGTRSTGYDPRLLAVRQLELAGDVEDAVNWGTEWVLETPGDRALPEWVALAARVHALAPTAHATAALGIERAALDRLEGRIDLAAVTLEATQPTASLELRWSVEWGRVLAMRYQLDAAVEAIARDVPAPNAAMAAYRQQMLGTSLSWAGRRSEALEPLEQAYAALVGLRRWASAGYCALRLSRLGGGADRERWLGLAEDAFERSDHAIGLASVESQRGHQARAAGRLDDAARHYEAFLRVTRAYNRGDTLFGEVNLGLVRMGQGRIEEALDQFEQTHGDAAASGASDAAFAALLGRLAASAHIAERADVAGLIARIEQDLTPGALEPDARGLLEEARRGVVARCWPELEVAVRSLLEAHD